MPGIFDNNQVRNTQEHFISYGSSNKYSNIGLSQVCTIARATAEIFGIDILTKFADWCQEEQGNVSGRNKRDLLDSFRYQFVHDNQDINKR